MNARITGIGLVAALALALPTSAVAAEEAGSVVPPENSAATQYTEAVPTAGGDKPSDGGGKKPSPAKVLGHHNAKRLESQGQEGREVARVVAETAPETSPPTEAAPPAQESSSSQGNSSRRTQSDQGGTSSGEPQEAVHPHHIVVRAAEPPTAPTELPSGSSGLGEVIAEATGSSSSGQLGGLLPLAVLATIAWSLAYFWRQRRSTS